MPGFQALRFVLGLGVDLEAGECCSDGLEGCEDCSDGTLAGLRRDATPRWKRPKGLAVVALPDGGQTRVQCAFVRRGARKTDFQCPAKARSPDRQTPPLLLPAGGLWGGGSRKRRNNDKPVGKEEAERRRYDQASKVAGRRTIHVGRPVAGVARGRGTKGEERGETGRPTVETRGGFGTRVSSRAWERKTLECSRPDVSLSLQS